MRMAVWAIFDDSRHGYFCDQCESNKQIWIDRGKCDGGFCGAFCGGDFSNGSWVVDCGVSIGSGAEHLGFCEKCPIGEILSNKPFLDKIFQEYKSLKRLNYRCDETIPIEYLIAIDEEIERLRNRNYERERKLAEAQRKTKGCK